MPSTTDLFQTGSKATVEGSESDEGTGLLGLLEFLDTPDPKYGIKDAT